MSEENVLSITGLDKKYGSIHAVNSLNLSVKKGSVFGLLGPNGSGKTTTLAMLVGVVQPNSGSFTWFNEEPTPKQRKRIGAILERPIFYPYMSAVENLKVVCQIKDVPYSKIDSTLKYVKLDDRKNDKFKTYSLGMKQRLSIASALLCDPEVMILDEPTNGLDPQGINEIREMITDIADSGKTIILASHLLDEVQKVCSDFAILSKGNLIYKGNVNVDLSDEPLIEVMAQTESDELSGILEKIKGVNAVERENGFFLLRVDPEVQPELISKELAKKEIYVTHLIKRKKTLEKRFLEVLKQND